MMQDTTWRTLLPGVDVNAHSCRRFGVGAAIVPFNFPAIIPFWFLPYRLPSAIRSSLKPSERVPFDHSGAPWNSSKDGHIPRAREHLERRQGMFCDALCDHPSVRRSGFVGRTPVQKTCVPRAAAAWSDRARAARRNHVIVFAGCGHGSSNPIHHRLCVGCAGQLVPGGFRRRDDCEAQRRFVDAMRTLLPYKDRLGLDTGVRWGLFSSPASREAHRGLIGAPFFPKGPVSDGAKPCSTGESESGEL